MLLVLLLLSSVKVDEREEAKNRNHDIVIHIHFECDWMISIAAFFRTVDAAAAAAAAIPIEQQFVIEKSTFGSHFVSKTKYIMELNVERIDGMTTVTGARLFAAVTEQDHSLATRRWFDLSY